MEKNILDFFNLNGSTVFITGAYSHLGSVISEGLGICGAKIIINGKNKNKLYRLQKILLKKKIQTSIACFDITNYTQVEKYFKKVKNLDVIVHNANNTRHTPLKKFEKKKYFNSFETAILALTNIVNCAVDKLKKSSKKNGTSSIINISSMYGMVSPDPSIYLNEKVASSPQYGAAKAALIHHTKYLAVHLAKYNIRVNSISPGPFPNINISSNKKFLNKLKEKTPLRRVGKAEELVSTVLYLASKSSSFTTGTNIQVDGGWTAW